MSAQTIVIAVGVFCLAYQVYVTSAILRKQHFERSQKAFQIALVWLIPLIGALLIYSFLRADGKAPYKPEKGYTEPSGNGG